MKDINEKLKILNQGHKIKLRAKAVNKKKDAVLSLYLDIYVDGIRQYEYLKMYLSGSQDDYIKLQTAIKIRDHREENMKIGRAHV